MRSCLAPVASGPDDFLEAATVALESSMVLKTATGLEPDVVRDQMAGGSSAADSREALSSKGRRDEESSPLPILTASDDKSRSERSQQFFKNGYTLTKPVQNMTTNGVHSDPTRGSRSLDTVD